MNESGEYVCTACGTVIGQVVETWRPEYRYYLDNEKSRRRIRDAPCLLEPGVTPKKKLLAVFLEVLTRISTGLNIRLSKLQLFQLALEAVKVYKKLPYSQGGKLSKVAKEAVAVAVLYHYLYSENTRFTVRDFAVMLARRSLLYYKTTPEIVMEVYMTAYKTTADLVDKRIIAQVREILAKSRLSHEDKTAVYTAAKAVLARISRTAIQGKTSRTIALLLVVTLLSELRGYSYSKIAELLGVNYSSIRSKLAMYRRVAEEIRELARAVIAH